MTHTSLQPHLTWGRKGGPCRPPLNKNPRGKVTAAPHHAPHGGGGSPQPRRKGVLPSTAGGGTPGGAEGGPHSPGGSHPPHQGDPPAPPHPQLQHGGVDGGCPVPLETGHHGGEEPVTEGYVGGGVVAGALARDGERPLAARTRRGRGTTPGNRWRGPRSPRYLGRLQSRAPPATG